MPQIADAETRHIYRLLIHKARQGARQVRFLYRCDSPGYRRLMEMRIHKDASGQVEFRSRVSHLERRDPANLFDHSPDRRSKDVLKVCGWCKAVWTQRDWVEVEQAVAQLGILTRPALPQISHGICPTCSERMTSLGEN